MINKYRNTTGIIFRLFNAKDADRVVHIITEDGSKLAVVATGVRKGTSRKAHAIDLLNTVSIKLSHAGSLESVTEAQLINNNIGFKQDYASLMFVELVCELLSIFLQEDQDESGYYRNLANMLETPPPHKLPLLAAGLILRFLHLNGTLPRLSEDVHTGEEMNAEQPRYSTNEIGYTAQPDAVGDPIPDRLYKTQRFMLQYDFTRINHVNLTVDEQLAILDLHVQWLELATDKQLKCMPMFRQAVL